MSETLKHAGAGRIRRAILIKKEASASQLEQERRFEDAEETTRPCAPKESYSDGVFRWIHLDDGRDLCHERIMYVILEMDRPQSNGFILRPMAT